MAPAVAGAPVRFSLSLVEAPSRRTGSLPAAPELAVEYVTSVDTEGGFAVPNATAEPVRVVPTLKPTWPPENRMHDVPVLARSMELSFEIETSDAGRESDAVSRRSVVRRWESRQKLLKEWADEKLRRDLRNLPEQATLDGYEGLPVEEFGEALLRGMGWEKGQPIGRNATVVVAPVETVKRQQFLGLGAVPAPRQALRASKAAG